MIPRSLPPIKLRRALWCTRNTYWFFLFFFQKEAISCLSASTYQRSRFVHRISTLSGEKCLGTYLKECDNIFVAPLVCTDTLTRCTFQFDNINKWTVLQIPSGRIKCQIPFFNAKLQHFKWDVLSNVAYTILWSVLNFIATLIAVYCWRTVELCTYKLP